MKRLLYIAALLILVMAGCSTRFDESIDKTTEVRPMDEPRPTNMEEYVHDRMQKLNDLGLVEMDAELEKTISEGFQSMPAEVMESMDDRNLTGMIITNIAFGDMNYETGEWTPSSDKIYTFDVEVFSIEDMYTQFLDGISHITQGDITITDIDEDTSQVDWENNEGRHIIRFKLNGIQCEYTAEVNYDWFDTDIITYFNDALGKQGFEKHLLATSDGYQDCIIFYNTEAWARQFEQTMGYPLEW